MVKAAVSLQTPLTTDIDHHPRSPTKNFTSGLTVPIGVHRCLLKRVVNITSKCKMSSSETSDSERHETLIMYYIWKKRYAQHRNMWVREIFLHREQLGEFHHLVPQLVEDEEKFYSYYRMNKACYNLLITKVKPLFTIGNTNCRATISFEERLTVTLRYLATGESYHSMSFRFRISHNRISVIVDGMLSLIYEALESTYLQFPDKQAFIKIAEEFFLKKKFPNCIGAIDGKHVRINKPFNCGSLYYNYKLYHSIILLAIVDVNYKFIMIDVGSYGKNSDGGVFQHSAFGKLFYQNKLDLPENKEIDENSKEPLPFVFVGDEAFGLSEHLLKPFPRRDLDMEKRRYNYRLSYTRQTVECTFGILASKFRIFETSIAVYPEKVDKIIKSACVLHNMIRVEENDSVETQTQDSRRAAAFESLQTVRKQSRNQSTRLARAIREKFCNYFSGIGAVEWQDARIQLNEANNNNL